MRPDDLDRFSFVMVLLIAFAFATGALHAGMASAQTVRLLVQSSPLAGYTYHQAPAIFSDMRAGDALALLREVDNPHDANAISVHWREYKLGYVPRKENAALAWAMDRGETLHARVSRLQAHRNPRLRVEFEVFVQ